MISSYYSMGLVAVIWLVLLWAGTRRSGGACRRSVKLIFGFTAVLLLFLPVGGLRLWSWTFGFCPNPSFPLIGVVCAGLWQRLFGLEVFKPADWNATWLFGAVAGSVLYLHPMLVGSLDLYYWGWEPAVSAGGLAALAITFLAFGNRFGVLLLGALLGYSLRALESENAWDYSLDPLYWIVSVAVVVGQTVARLRAWRRAARSRSAIGAPA
jgi:hypothetical protein